MGMITVYLIMEQQWEDGIHPLKVYRSKKKADEFVSKDNINYWVNEIEMDDEL